MKIVFQRSSDADVRWFSNYYRHVFPEGIRKARIRLDKALRTLADNPRIGHLINGSVHREFSVSQTPFSLIYRVSTDRIEILRLWDQRRDHGERRREGSTEE